MGGNHRARRRARTTGGAGRAVLILGLVLVVLAGAGGWAYLWATGASGPTEPVTVDIPQGATAGEVGEMLEAEEVIRSALAFRIAASRRGLGSSLLAGSYRLSTNMPLFEVLDVLERGPAVREVSLTIPEGYELADVAGEVEEALGIPARRFRKLATSGTFALPPYLPEGTETVEGFLYPETYGFAEDADAESVILRLLSQFESEAEGLPWEGAKRLGLTPYEVVVVASMVEREARVDQDRAKIAAVIYNRIEEGMRLQIDATIQYALPEPNRLLTNEDYEYESPYNTYLIDGLPPTPIGSPSAASLEAALSPADVDYLFFVAVDDSGAHEFAETYEEFLRLKEKAGL